MLNRIFTLSAVAAALAAIPTLAGAQGVAYGNAAPITVTSCSVAEFYVPGLPIYESSVHTVTGSLELGFINKNNIPATTVKVLQTDGRYSQEIVDKGTFAPGITIEHSFQPAGGTSASENANCRVTEVDFSDGSTWHAASPKVAGR